MLDANGDVEDSPVASIGSRIRYFRTRAGLSRAELAAMAGMSPPLIRQLEVGRSPVAVRTVRRLARALEIAPEQLLRGPAPSNIQVVRNGGKRHGGGDATAAPAIARVSAIGTQGITELREYKIYEDGTSLDWLVGDGEHVLYVVEGGLWIEFDGQPEVVLNEGDAAAYDARLPHRWRSAPRARVILLIVDRAASRSEALLSRT